MKKKIVSSAFVSALVALVMLVGFARATVDPLQQEIITTITLDDEPQCIAVNEATNRVYVGLEDGLLVIDGETDTVITEILPGVDVVALVVNPQTNRIYVADYSDHIFVIDGANNQQVGAIPDGIYQPYEFAVNPTTNLVYLADWTTILGYYDKILVYSGENLTKVTEVNIPGSNEHTIIERIGLAVNPETNILYATWSGNNTLYAINGNTHEIIETVSPSSFSRELTINTYTNYIYIGNVVLACDTLVEVVSGYEGTLEAVDSVNNRVYTVGYSGGHYNLYVLDGTTHGTVTSLELDWWFSSYSDCVGVNGQTDKVYLVDSSEHQIPVVLIPEFHALTSVMLVLVAFAAAFFIYTRTVSHEPIHKQSSAV